MGLILSKIYDKPSTRDTLEKIEQEIQNIEEKRWDKIKREQFIVQILSFLPLTILIANLCILIYPSDSTWRDKLLLSVPIAILNLILWVSRKMVQWYSRWSLDNEEANLRKLQKQKKKILEMVCETESYRVATELLEKYDPKQLRRREKPALERPSSPHNTTLTKINASPIRAPHQQQPKQRPMHSPPNHNQSFSFFNQPPPIPNPLPVPAPPPPTPISKPSSKPQLNTTSANIHNTSLNTSIAASSVQGRPVRPILSKDRSFIEKVVDWVVADGPDNRFALVCRFCYGHNGMSLAEEFETINFRCCYCYNLNTATNKRHQVHDQLQPDREKAESKAKESTNEPESDKLNDIKEDPTQEESELGSKSDRNDKQSSPEEESDKADAPSSEELEDKEASEGSATAQKTPT